MFRRGHMCFQNSDLCLRVHMSILEYHMNEIKDRGVNREHV